MPACPRSPLVSAIAAIGLALVGCAAPGAESSPPADQAAEVEFNDPLEEWNRSIFGFNQVVNEVALVPVAKGYRTAVPPPMRASVHDFLENLNAPVIFANDVLQAQPRLFAHTRGRP